VIHGEQFVQRRQIDFLCDATRSGVRVHDFSGGVGCQNRLRTLVRDAREAGVFFLRSAEQGHVHAKAYDVVAASVAVLEWTFDRDDAAEFAVRRARLKFGQNLFLPRIHHVHVFAQEPANQFRVTIELALGLAHQVRRTHPAEVGECLVHQNECAFAILDEHQIRQCVQDARVKRHLLFELFLGEDRRRHVDPVEHESGDLVIVQ
jgi:hypothetical protein